MANTIQALQSHFSHLHPLIFARSQERAKTPGELFDLLSTAVSGYPLVWNEQERRWEQTDDLLQAKAPLRRI